MIRFFVTFFLFFLITLSGADDFELLKRADKYASSSTKANQFRAYNDYKNIYLRALMNEDQKLKVCALEGIVKCGTKLHIDISQYSEELEKFQEKKSVTTHKSFTKQTNDIRVSSSHKLQSIRWKDGRLVLNFDRKLLNNQINYFQLYDPKTSTYKYVFDVHASMLTKSQTLKKQDIEKIKLAQFNPTTLRLVIQNSSKVAISFKKDKTQLIIKMVPKKSSTPLQTPKQVPHRTITPSRLDRNKVIVIDAGHGGKDPGAIGYRGYREKVVVLQIAQELNTILKSRGFKVYMTRSNDRFIRLRDRTKYANRKKADLFISIHANAVSKKQAKQAYGIECYFLDKSRSSRAKKVAAQENSADMSEMDYYGKQSFLSTLSSHNIVASNKLAIDLQRGALGSLRKSYKDVKDAGVRPAPFWVLVGAQMPSVLVEVGFISNPKEAKRLVNSQYQKKMAYGLANGIERYFVNN